MTRLHSVDVDRKAGSAYLYFEKPKARSSPRQINVGDSVILDFGADGRLVGIEILDPRLARNFSSPPARKALRRSHVAVRTTG